METNELKLDYYVSLYLPYKVDVFDLVSGDFFELDSENIDSTMNDAEHLNTIRLILRPLSELTNDKFDFIYNKEVDYPSIENWISLDTETRLTYKFSYTFWQELFNNNFDVFGLIEKGLAIDINTLKS